MNEDQPVVLTDPAIDLIDEKLVMSNNGGIRRFVCSRHDHNAIRGMDGGFKTA